MSECYSFVVNGVPCSTEEEKPLLRYLRDELRLEYQGLCCYVPREDRPLMEFQLRAAERGAILSALRRLRTGRYAKEPPPAPAVRLRLPDETVRFVDGHYGPVEQNLARECGDIILRRSDGVFAYQLAVVLDDIAMGVTQVVRGRDLLSSTPRQMYLYRLFGASPPQYIHVPLLLARDGRRLSKREHDLDLGALRARGFSGEEIVGRVAYLAGLLPHPRPARPRDLLPLFSWEKVPKENLVLPEDLFRDAQ